jgi:hypothetical protein
VLKTVRCLWYASGLFVLFLAVPAFGQTAPSLESVQHRAFDFFWTETNPETGLTKDRARNIGSGPDEHTVASIASTGYMLAALPIGVEHKWVARDEAYDRAQVTLEYVHDRLKRNHGFYYHFIDWKSGERVWSSELSSIDTALLVMGALVAGEYWHNTPLKRLADEIAGRVDWQWMQTQGGDTPDALAPSMGWTPEKGWISYRWQGYNESAFLYLLGLGTPKNGLKRDAWQAWTFPTKKVEGYDLFGGPAPIFMAQMTAGFFNLKGLRDLQGRDWWAMWRNAHLADQAYCTTHTMNKTFAAGFWGINASDQPDGYGAEQPEDGKNTGTVSPTAMLAAILFTPEESKKALADLWALQDKIWGRYGFSNAFNLDKDWYDPDVIGIDLGMMLLATENARSGLIWRLVGRSPFAKRGLAAAGFHPAPAKP